MFYTQTLQVVEPEIGCQETLDFIGIKTLSCFIADHHDDNRTCLGQRLPGFNH